MSQLKPQDNESMQSSEKEFKFKKTALDSNAEIYEQKNDDKKDIKRTWKSLDKSEKLQFFKDYFLVKLILTITSCACIGYILFSIFGPHTETIYYAAIMQQSSNNAAFNTLEKELSNLLQPQKRETILLNTNFNYSDTNSTLSGQEKLSITLSAGEIDTIICPYEPFQEYSYYGYLTNLSVFLPKDILESLSPYLLTAQVNSADNEETFDPEIINTLPGLSTYTLGIDLSKCEKYMSLHPDTQNPVLSVPSNCPNKENILKVIRFLFDLPQLENNETSTLTP